ncbi:MAG: 4-alpha-glucanotransferase [Erysipelotrichaceae bacterium]
MRETGVILPIFSLSSNYGIGTIGKKAYEFIDFLEKADVSYWQMLPLNPTGYGDSPYQSFSTFASNPYFIDLELLMEDGLLSDADLRSYVYNHDPLDIDYKCLYDHRFEVLKKAFERDQLISETAINDFKVANSDWLNDYSLFMAIKNYFQGDSWDNWPNDIKFREEGALTYYRDMLNDEIEFQVYIQYLFDKQFKNLKNYANNKGIKFLGDMPIYVAYDSSDVWSNPKLFKLNEDLSLQEVAGCPPDAFSLEGQLWGNPIYQWDYHEQENYGWWIKRIKHAFKYCDKLRIDHFRGFESYWSIKYPSENAINGCWIKGPGKKLFDAIKNQLGEIDVIAEDLGFITEDVKELLDYVKYPGMKVLEFGFDETLDNDHIVHNYIPNCVAYTGTHDNDTVRGWYENLSEEERMLVNQYGAMKDENDDVSFIKMVLASEANIAVIQMQDLLSLGSDSRMNIPSTLGTNWRFRLGENALDSQYALKLKSLSNSCGRKIQSK